MIGGGGIGMGRGDTEDAGDALAHLGGGSPKRAWTRERVARLAYLVGRGFTAKTIAVDPSVRTTAGNVYRQAGRFGLALAAAPSHEVRVRLPAATLAVLERDAAREGMMRDAYVRHLLLRATG